MIQDASSPHPQGLSPLECIKAVQSRGCSPWPHSGHTGRSAPHGLSFGSSEVSILRIILFLCASLLAVAANIPVHMGDNLQTAITGASCGDSLILDAGATWDGTFLLPNKSCSSGTPITITSSAAASLPVCTGPTTHVNPADATNMPRIRTLGGGTIGAAIEMTTGANYWILDGLELTDNAANTAVVNAEIDGTSGVGVGHLTVERSYIHQKETGTNWNRTIQRATWFDGDTLTEACNYIYIIGYYYPTAPGIGNNHTTMDSTSILSIVGANITEKWSYVSVWWNGIFLGGGDTAPQNTATLSGASTTSATFSNVTGVASGLVIRFGVQGTGTLVSSGSSGTLTITSGPMLTSADIGGDGLSASIEITDAAPSRLLQCTSIAGNVCTFTWVQSSTHPANGAYAFTLLQTAQVSGVAGSVVNYTPNSHDKLLHTPQVAAWNTGTQGTIHDVTLQGNTFYIDPAFAANVFSQNGNCPKGGFEIKNVDIFTVVGNYYTGYPAVLAMTPANQNGTAPWTTTRNVTIQSNWIDPLTPSACKRSGLLFIDHEDLHTVSPSINFNITNNFMGAGIQNILGVRPASGNTWSMTHNTAINTVGGFDYNGVVTDLQVLPGWTFSNNIANYMSYGMNCLVPPNTLAACFPSGVFQNNVMTDTQAVGYGTSVWGAGSVLAPIPTATSQIGFTDLAGQVYSLAVTSPYKGAGTGGSDPGVDWTALLAALGSSPTPPSTTSTSITGQVTISGRASIQ